MSFETYFLVSRLQISLRLARVSVILFQPHYCHLFHINSIRVLNLNQNDLLSLYPCFSLGKHREDQKILRQINTPDVFFFVSKGARRSVLFSLFLGQRRSLKFQDFPFLLQISTKTWSTQKTIVGNWRKRREGRKLL